MKNKIFIDIDSERDRPILFSKGEDIPKPTTHEEAKDMLITDIVCLSESLLSLIHLADQNGLAKKEDLVNQCVTLFLDYLKPETPKDNEETNTES